MIFLWGDAGTGDPVAEPCLKESSFRGIN